ncbi:glutathione S-transferase [Aphelenchoides avenae]|nr:glutathione S-transferase [Aphelenchus avenae]
MVNYKIVYFDGRGPAETARLILTHEGIDFEDVRIPHAEWPGDYKAKAPFGKVPYLEVDGKKLPESFAISRYLARKYGLAGKDDWEQAWVDAIADSFKDVLNELRPFMMAAFGRGGDKEKLQKDIFEPTMEKLLPQIEKFLKDSGSGYLVKGGYTWVDFFYANQLLTIESLVPGSVNGNAAVKAYVERVHNIPKIKEYVASRKTTPF